MKTYKCCICGREFEGIGNNPYPVSLGGECCDACNLQKVIPDRVMLMQLANQITSKVASEIRVANARDGIDGVNKVLKKYDLLDTDEDLEIEESV